MGKTKIDWATHVWNPTVGCTAVTNGCRYCYARRLHDQRHKAALEGKRVPALYLKPFSEVQMLQARVDDPLRWRLYPRRRIFVDSMSDLFHQDVSDDFIARLWASMRLAPTHSFLILTKRPERAAEFTNSEEFANKVRDRLASSDWQWPLPNVWIGASVSNQADLEKFMPYLRRVRAAGRFLSVEPMLGSMDLTPWLHPDYEGIQKQAEWTPVDVDDYRYNSIDWVICGGETGGKYQARPVHQNWVRDLRDQCVVSGTPFFFKQWGDAIPYDQATEKQRETAKSGFTTIAGNGESGDVGHWLRLPKSKAGHLLDGVEWRQYPDRLKDGDEISR